jgi:hypothetical protein
MAKSKRKRVPKTVLKLRRFMNYDFMKASNSTGCGRWHMWMVDFAISAISTRRIFETP